jgi:hypothetical protein
LLIAFLIFLLAVEKDAGAATAAMRERTLATKT